MAALKMFLMLVGAFLVALVLFVLILLLWLRYKLRSFVKSVEELASTATLVPPFRVHLEQVDEPDWNRKEEVDEISSALEEAGFKRAGDFQADELAGVALRALCDSQRRIDAVIYDHSQVGVWFDLVCRYADGRNYTYTTASQTGLANPPFLVIEHHPGAEPQELLQHCLSTRPADGLQMNPVEKFPSRFEDAYAREMDWRGERGGPSEEEIRAIAAKSGQEATPEYIEQVRGAWRGQLNYHLEEEIRAVFLEEARLSAKRWEEVRERLIFIHDRMSETDVLGAFETALAMELQKRMPQTNGDENDGEDDRYEEALELRHEELRRTASGLTPRAAFGKMNLAVSPEYRFERIGEVTRPLPADVYLTPEEMY